MAGKYYAVKEGLSRGIFLTWEECKASVNGYSGAVYKSFKTRQDCVKIYVDGSYNSAAREFSYGMVVLSKEGEETYSQKFDDVSLAAMHNVAGEIKGAQAAMQYALDHQIPAIEIYHDYEGIAKWCLGLWKTNKEGTKAYKEFYEIASRHVKISFVKVAGHSNDKYNDMADELAKKALGL